MGKGGEKGGASSLIHIQGNDLRLYVIANRILEDESCDFYKIYKKLGHLNSSLYLSFAPFTPKNIVYQRLGQVSLFFSYEGELNFAAVYNNTSGWKKHILSAMLGKEIRIENRVGVGILRKNK